MDQCVGAALKSSEYVLEKMGRQVRGRKVELAPMESTASAPPPKLLPSAQSGVGSG
jgi:hypothetical protein